MPIGCTMGRDLRHNRDDDDEDFGRRSQSFRRRDEQRDRKMRERGAIHARENNTGVVNGTGRSNR